MFRITAAALLSAAAAHAELTATFTRDGQTDSRIDRLPALSVKPGEPPTPFLSAGPFEVVWTAKLSLPSRQRLAFSFEGSGNATLEVGGEEVLVREGDLAGESSETLRLNPGEHDFKLTYRSNEDGSAALRVFWEERSFPRQAIPPNAFASEPPETAVLGELQREGRMIFTQQHCAKCHAPEQGFPAGSMPETAEIGPLLFGIQDRVSEEWLRRWIADPHAIRPTTEMPDLIDASTGEGRQQVADLAAFLMSGPPAGETAATPDPALAKAGGVHFHELGCVACHSMPDRAEPDLENARVPLNNVALKWKPGALVSYLKNPAQFHTYTKMPDFMMSDEEATSIAAYLLEASDGKHTEIGVEFPEGDPKRGEEAAKALDCGVCHPGVPLSGQPAGPSLQAVFKADWMEKGCAAPPEKRGEGLPVLNLGDEDRKALAAFSKTGIEPLTRHTGSEFARRQIEALRCTACHTLDDQKNLLDLLHGDSKALAEHIEGLHERVDQTRPQLTYTGEMLYSSFIEAMLQGTADPRPRPWLGTRMPAFRAHAKPLAEGLARMHGYEPTEPEKLEVDPELAEVGKLLVGAEGFGCTTCHGVGDMKPTAAFEVEGVNFDQVPARLRYGYYHRWMDNPPAVTPGTKMPRYSDGDKSQRRDILQGDASKQFEAIWHYLHSLDD